LCMFVNVHFCLSSSSPASSTSSSSKQYTVIKGSPWFARGHRCPSRMRQNEPGLPAVLLLSRCPLRLRL
jgi:hypothetical protein